MIQSGVYKHYKGPEYLVLNTAFHSETQGIMVLYFPLYGENKLWVRPIEMFLESVLVEGKELQRFSYIREPSAEEVVLRNRVLTG